MTETVNTKKILELFGVNRSRVTVWVNEGMPKLGRGKFDLAECIQWRVARAEKVTEEKIKGSDSRQRLTETNAEIKTLELKQIQRELVSAEVVNQILQEYATLIATQLDSIGPRICQELAVMDQPAEIMEAINDETRKARDSLASFILEYADTFNPEDLRGDSKAAA